MDNRSEITRLAQEVRTSRIEELKKMEQRNQAIRTQHEQERTPFTVLAVWTGLTEQQIRRICQQK